MDMKGAQDRLKIIQSEGTREEIEYKTLGYLQGIKLRQRLLLKDGIDTLTIKDFENRQIWSCEYYLKKYTDIPKEDYKVYIAEFFNKFYKGEVKSFYEYLIAEGFKIQCDGARCN